MCIRDSGITIQSAVVVVFSAYLEMIQKIGDRMVCPEMFYVFPWLMNNYWTTNFRASQEGEFKCGFVISSTQDLSLIHIS